MAVIEKRIYNNGKIRYRVKIRLKGFPVQHATFSSISKAKLWIQQTESAIREGRHFRTHEAKKHNMADLIERYIRDILPKKPKSLEKQTMQLSWWKSHLGHVLLSDITPALIAEKRDELASGITIRHTKRSSATVARYMAVLSHAFTIAVQEWNWIDDNPMRKVSKPKEPQGRVRFLDEAERNNLLEACKNSKNPYLFTIVVLAVSTGMRCSEILNLSWNNVDLETRRIVLHQTKNGERRGLPLVGLAYELIYKLSKHRRLDTYLLFPGKKPQHPVKIRSSWDRAVKTAEIKNFRFHDLRHTAASYLAMNKATLSEIADILGHKTLSMVKRYSHISENHTTGVIERMNTNVFGKYGIRNKIGLGVL